MIYWQLDTTIRLFLCSISLPWVGYATVRFYGDTEHFILHLKEKVLLINYISGLVDHIALVSLPLAK